jgi:hypothetical protein
MATETHHQIGTNQELMWFNILLASLLHQHMVSSFLKATTNLDAFLAHTL